MLTTVVEMKALTDDQVILMNLLIKEDNDEELTEYDLSEFSRLRSTYPEWFKQWGNYSIVSEWNSAD